MNKAPLLFFSILISFNVSAGILGPSDPGECFEKYWPKVRLEDARDVVMRACGVVYGANDFNDEVKIVSRCILKKSENMYSFESSLKAINNCTKKYPQFFKYYQDVLMERTVAMVELQKRQARIDRYLNKPTTLIDMNTGLPRPCQQIGNILHCD